MHHRLASVRDRIVDPCGAWPVSQRPFPRATPTGNVGAQRARLPAPTPVAIVAAVGPGRGAGEERFGDEFTLSADRVASLDDEWRLAYIARLLHSAAYLYGVSPHASPGRSADGELTSPISWSDELSLARLLRGLNDILYGVDPTNEPDPPSDGRA